MPSSIQGATPSGTDVRLDVEIGLPPGWWQLPVGEHVTAASVADVIDPRISPRYAPERDEIVKLAQATASEATGAGAVLAAQIGVVDGSEIFSASLVVAFEAFAGIDAPDELEAFLRAAEAGSPTPAPSVLEPCAVGRVGPGLRRSTVGRRPDGTPVASVRYYAVVPGTGRTVIVDCTSGNVDDLPGLQALFGDIVATLDITVS